MVPFPRAGHIYFHADNYIDGAEFVGLTLPEIREIVQPIGLAKKFAKLIPKVCCIALVVCIVLLCVSVFIVCFCRLTQYLHK